MNTLQTAAQDIAQRTGQKVGIAILPILIPILTAILPEILKCLAPRDSADVADHVNARYDPARAGNAYGGYDRDTVHHVARMARREAKRQGTSLTKDQAIVAAIETLDEARNSQLPRVGTALAEAGV